MRYAFDLDGTLLDTRAAVLAAYRLAGVEPPHDFFGRTFREWFRGEGTEASAIHKAKCEHYVETVKYVKKLPLMTLFELLVRRGQDVRILTGASHSAIMALSVPFSILRTVPVVTSLSMQAKAAVLNETPDRGIMFEDDSVAARFLGDNTRWTICCTY